MYGFGDLILVLFVGFALSLPPTLLGLWWIRRTKWLWAVGGVIAVIGGLASLPLLMVARALLLHALTGR